MQTPRAPQRGFTHREAGATENYELVDSPATDRGKMLASIEFLARYATPRGEKYVALFTEAPGFIQALARLFPHVQFYVFGQVEYNPDNPAINGAKNIVEVNAPFSTEYALHLGKRDRRENLLMVCHESRDRSLINHALIRPNWSLLAMGDVGQDFFEGELLYPIHAPPRARLAYMVVHCDARARTYDPAIFQEELAFFHAVTRSTPAYDEQAETAVLHQFVKAILEEHDGDRAWLAAEQARCFLPRL